VSNFIFCDIDGVLRKYPHDHPHMAVDDHTPGRLETMLRVLDAKLVITSSWNFGKTPQSMRSALWKLGMQSKVDFLTKDSGNGRAADISAFLDTHPEVSQYAVLDDDRDVLNIPNSFLIDGNVGLSDNDVERVVKSFR